MILPQLFKKDSAGNIRVWSAEVRADRHRTLTGVLGGKIIESGWTTAVPASKPTGEEQAEFEAWSLWRQKKDVGYVETLDAAKAGETTFFQPMLAKEYDPAKIDFSKPVFFQPKLDGMRCIARADGLWSRNGKRIRSVPHIEKELAPFFAEYPHIVLDGELYNHAYKNDFQALMSIARKEKLSVADLDRAKVLQYHVYDLFDADNPGLTFEKRYDYLVEVMMRHLTLSIIVPVDTWNLQDDGEEDPTVDSDDMYSKYLEQGYEGGMYRLDMPYEHKRSGALLKRKDFNTDEFTILDIVEGEGNWAGCAKEIQLTDGTVEFSAGIRGTQPEMRKLLAEKDKHIAGDATVRFFGKTNDGLPRFPVVIDLHQGKRTH